MKIFEYLDPSVPTTVSPKTNLIKGDLFVVCLNDEGTQKLVMQVDRVDDERQIQSPIPGRKNISYMFIFHWLYSIEIFIDESIRKTFSVISFVSNHYMVQKVTDREVRF